MIDQLDLLAALKNNPYHDKRTGRFSFAPGGPRIPENYTKEYHEAVEDLNDFIWWTGDDRSKWTAEDMSEFKRVQSRVQEEWELSHAAVKAGYKPGEMTEREWGEFADTMLADAKAKMKRPEASGGNISAAYEKARGPKDIWYTFHQKEVLGHDGRLKAGAEELRKRLWKENERQANSYMDKFLTRMGHDPKELAMLPDTVLGWQQRRRLVAELGHGQLQKRNIGKISQEVRQRVLDRASDFDMRSAKQLSYNPAAGSAMDSWFYYEMATVRAGGSPNWFPDEMLDLHTRWNQARYIQEGGKQAGGSLPVGIQTFERDGPFMFVSQEMEWSIPYDVEPGGIDLMSMPEHWVGLDVPVERGIVKHLPGQHNQQTHGRGKSSGRIVDQDKRVWQGQQVEGKKTISKLETGELGERAAMMALEDVYGQPFETLNVGMNNAPIDVIGDHTAVEVKAGMSINGKTAQHWRATIGQPGKAEREALKQMTPKEKRAHNQRKSEAIIQRKAELLQQLGREAGSEIKGKTVGVILSPDGKRADVFMVDGFHLRLPWKKYATGDNYIGTYGLE